MYIFIDIFSEVSLSIFPRDHFINIVKSIVTPYRIIIIP